MGNACRSRVEPVASFDRPFSADLFKAAFIEGPYVLAGDGGRLICVEIGGEPQPIGIALKTVHDHAGALPYLATAHLFKAAPDLYQHTAALALLAEQANTLTANELRAALLAHREAAMVALARAVGLLG